MKNNTDCHHDVSCHKLQYFVPGLDSNDYIFYDYDIRLYNFMSLIFIFEDILVEFLGCFRIFSSSIKYNHLDPKLKVILE